MTATIAPEPIVDADRPARGLHRRVVRHLEPAPPRAYQRRRDVRSARLLGAFSTVVVGTLLGGVIGGVLGGAVGVWFIVIGALYGAPVGAVVGAVVGLPASMVLAAVLVTGRADGPEAATRRTATTLAVLFELLIGAEVAAAALGIANVYGDTIGDASGRAFEATAGTALLLTTAIVLYGWLELRLLRWATRVLADDWNDINGWRAVR